MDSRVCSIAIALCMISCCRAQANYTSEFRTATGLSSGVNETVSPTGVPVSSSVQSTTATTTTAAKAATQPNAPRTLKVVDRRETSLKFTWSAPEQPVSVDRYEYTVTKQGEDTGTVNTVTTLSARQESLTPGAKYTIRVLAVKSDVKSDETTIEDSTVPADVGDVRESTNTSTSVQIMWTEPQQGSVFDGFEVTWTLANSSTQLGKETIEKGLRLKQLTGLTPGQNYRVTVRTMSHGLFSRGIAQDVSTQAPGVVGLMTKDIQTQSINISWSRPTGAVNGYNLLIGPTYGGTGLSANLTATNAVQEYTFDALFPGRTYTLGIIVVSPSGRSPAFTQTVTTRPLPVEQFEAAASGESTIRLSWRTSSSTQTTKFVIKYREKTVNYSSSSTGQLVKYISGLQSGSTTTFTIQPFSGWGNHVIGGTKSSVTETTVPSRVTNLNVQIVSATSAKVSWDPAPMSIQDKYQVRYQNTTTHTWSAWEEVLAPAHHKDIDQLFPGIQHRFEVLAQSKHQKSSAVSATGTTYPLPPVSVSVDKSWTTEDSVLVKWEYNAHVNHVTHWKVTYTVQDTSDWKLHSYYPIPLSTTETTLGNLVSGQNYTVCVYSLTAGEVQSETCTRTDATVKPSRLESFREVTERGSTTHIAAEYTGPSGNGVFDHYVFSINASTNIHKKTVNYGPARGEIIFSGLTPGSYYQVSAVTVSGVEESTQLHVDTVTEQDERGRNYYLSNGTWCAGTCKKC